MPGLDMHDLKRLGVEDMIDFGRGGKACWK